MFDFFKQHELVFVLIVVLLVAGSMWHYERWKDRQALRTDNKFIWQCVLVGGGSSVWTPNPMTEEEALKFLAPMGSAAYVDRQHHKIFYRARGA